MVNGDDLHKDSSSSKTSTRNATQVEVKAASMLVAVGTLFWYQVFTVAVANFNERIQKTTQVNILSTIWFPEKRTFPGSPAEFRLVRLLFCNGCNLSSKDPWSLLEALLTPTTPQLPWRWSKLERTRPT